MENWIKMKKWSTEIAGYKVWSKIKLVQNSNKIDAISYAKQSNYFIEWKQGLKCHLIEVRDQRYLVF